MDDKDCHHEFTVVTGVEGDDDHQARCLLQCAHCGVETYGWSIVHPDAMDEAARLTGGDSVLLS